MVFASASVASGLAGVAAHLKNNTEIKRAAVITAFLNASMLGLAMSLVWFRSFKDNVYGLVGMCILMGLLGAAGQEFILSLILKSGLTINFNPKKDKEDAKTT